MNVLCGWDIQNEKKPAQILRCFLAFFLVHIWICFFGIFSCSLNDVFGLFLVQILMWFLVFILAQIWMRFLVFILAQILMWFSCWIWKYLCSLSRNILRNLAENTFCTAVRCILIESSSSLGQILQKILKNLFSSNLLQIFLGHPPLKRPGCECVSLW